MGDKRKNPWGSSGDKRPGGPWGGNGGGNGGRGPGGGMEPHDLDEMLRKARENLNAVIPGGMGSGKFMALLAAAVLGLWLISGFYVVNPGEQAVVKRFGGWSRTQAEPGLGYRLPYPIEAVELVNVEEIRVMSIGFNQANFRNASSGSRIDVPEESLMLTSDRNIVDLDLVIQWNIKSAENFLFEIKDQDNTIKKVAESAIREVIGQTDMFQIITTGRAAIADRTQQIIQENLDRYTSGVSIKQILIQKAEVHPEVQSAFQDVQSAKQDSENVQNKAQAYREDILPRARGRAIQMIQEAEGYRDSAVARAKGDAERFEAIYESYLTGKDVTRERLFIETMENVLSNASKMILGSGASDQVVPYLPLNEIKKSSGSSNSTPSTGQYSGR